MNAAKKLSLDEIKELPKASVIWMQIFYTSDDGIEFYSLDPVMISVSGDTGFLIGGNRDYLISRDIDEHLLDDPITFWDMEPDKSQLVGISEEEFNAMI